MNPYHLKGTAKFLRYQNSQGKVIPLHHAFKTLALSSFSRVTALVLPVLFVSVLWLFLPYVMDFWGDILGFWMRQIYNGSVGREQETILGLMVQVPYPDLDASMPSNWVVVGNLFACILGLIISILFPTRAMPLTYLLRTMLVVQASASIDRIVSPNFFPYTLKLYMIDELSLCVHMLILLPILLGMVYYIFDFSVWRKCLLTLMMIAYYVLFIPCQYMLHACLIHSYTLLVMPFLYIFFGVLVDVLAFVSIYAYGMSWKSHPKALQGRGI